MSASHTAKSFPPVRACIFDVDGLLINSEDIYTEAMNNILHEYGRPAKQQSRGTQVSSKNKAYFNVMCKNLF